MEDHFTDGHGNVSVEFIEHCEALRGELPALRARMRSEAARLDSLYRRVERFGPAALMRQLMDSRIANAKLQCECNETLRDLPPIADDDGDNELFFGGQTDVG
jgi:hypothetical protein